MTNCTKCDKFTGLAFGLALFNWSNNVNTKTKKCTKCGEVKEVGEFTKNKNGKDGLFPQCRSCKNKYMAEYYKNNKDKIAGINSRYYKNNKDKLAKIHTKYYKNNKDNVAKRVAEHYKNNKDKITKRRSEYRKNNKGLVCYHSMMRYTRKRGLTPPLTTYDKERIEALYEEAKQLEKQTGKPHHVDHVWPISKGGVHHWCNLMVVTAEENLSKGDRHDGVSGVSYQDYMLAQQAI